MPRSLRLTLVPLAALALACSHGSPVEGDAEPSPGAFAPLRRETVLVDAVTPVAPDPYMLEQATVANDSLHVRVRFGGGCRTHEFRLMVFTTFRESYPVQVDALLGHAANGDSCRALLVRDMRFDLAPIRDLYRRTYRTTNGVIRLRLLPPGEGTVEYRF